MYRYVWQPQDTIWRVAARYLAESGFADTPTLVAAIQAANLADQPHAPGDDPALWGGIFDWQAVPAGRVVTLPTAP